MGQARKVKKQSVEKDEAVKSNISRTDTRYIKGQESVKRALEVAFAGRHTVLVIGSSGNGKTTLLREFALHFDKDRFMHIRAPITKNIYESWALENVGVPVILFEELSSFSQDMSTLLIKLIDKGHHVLIDSMACPCGNYTDANRVCECENEDIKKYQSKFSPRLIDRIDILIEMYSFRVKDFYSEKGEYTEDIFKRIKNARNIQMKRQGFLNSHLSVQNLEADVFRLDTAGNELLKMAATKLHHFNMRTIHSVIKVARTIADLSESNHIRPEHISEAIQYRSSELNQ